MDHINTSQAILDESAHLCFGLLRGSCPYQTIIRISLYIFFLSAALLTVSGNILIIIAIVHFKQLHTPTNYLILSLAVSDLLVGGIVMPPRIIKSVESCWYFGELFCKFHTSTDITCSAASILNLSLISIDRYYAINQPLKYGYKMTESIIALLTSFVWAVSVLSGFGPVFSDQSKRVDHGFDYNTSCVGTCIILPNMTSSVIHFLFSFCIPGLMMLCLYLKIYLIARQQAHSIHNMNIVKKAIDRRASKMEMKATKTLALVVGAFFSFWLPFFICSIVHPLIGYSVHPVLFDMFLWIGYLNSACNPLVYALFYSWFRKAFKVILSGQISQSDSSKTNLFTD